MSPELVAAVPEIVAYDGEVGLEFTEPVSRVRPYALERREGEGWVWVFSMTSDIHSSDWWHAGADVDAPDDVYTEMSITLPFRIALARRKPHPHHQR